MPQRVIWNLNYPTESPEQLATFRHHYETLRLDAHVASVSCEERTDRPHMMVMRVEFTEGHERPDNQALRFADALYPSQMRHLERDIQVHEVSPERARSIAEMMETFRTEIRAHPTYDALRQARIPETVTIPPWIVIGNTYRIKQSPAEVVVTLRNLRVQPGLVVLDTVLDDVPGLASGATAEYTLDEFTRLFEVYVRPAPPKTSWSRILEDDED